jgi:hypothetical protein
MWLIVCFILSTLATALFLAACIVGKRADRDNGDCQ